jgi:predicted protein tyrosine phosphatase
LGDGSSLEEARTMTLRSTEHEAFAAAGGAPKHYLLVELEDFRAEARQTTADAEDVVLDVMDFVDGWSSPHAKL